MTYEELLNDKLDMERYDRKPTYEELFDDDDEWREDETIGEYKTRCPWKFGF